MGRPPFGIRNRDACNAARLDVDRPTPMLKHIARHVSCTQGLASYGDHDHQSTRRGSIEGPEPTPWSDMDLYQRPDWECEWKAVEGHSFAFDRDTDTDLSGRDFIDCRKIIRLLARDRWQALIHDLNSISSTTTTTFQTSTPTQTSIQTSIQTSHTIHTSTPTTTYREGISSAAERSSKHPQGIYGGSRPML